MSTNGGNDPTPSIDDLTEQMRRNQTTPKPGLFAGYSLAQIALIGVVGLLLACVALSVAFIVIGIAAPVLIITAIILLILAFKRPTIVTNVTTRWPFRVLPSVITAGPVRFAVILACVLIPISGFAGATVYRGALSNSGNSHHTTRTTLAAIANMTPSPTVSMVFVTNTATAAAVISSPAPPSTPAPPTPTLSAALPTPTPVKPTVTATTAILGASTAAFIAKLGQPDPNGTTSGGSGIYNFNPCPSGQGDEFMVLFSNNQAVSINRFYCSGTTIPNEGVRTAEALTFAPPDAVRHGQTTSENGSPAPVFMSLQLTRTLTADAFVDCDQNSVPAGTFALGLEQGWDLIAGTCP